MNKTSCLKQNDVLLEDEDIFDDSLFLAKFEDSSLQENKANNSSFNQNPLNVSALCCDEEISGYDKLTGKTWIYPTNYPLRDYQYNIIKAAILKNTLVSLPTGLGKTFIAAVIMYNFYRWYPLGKIVFTAPTRPLVAQQIDACYNIIGIPPDDTIEMTGTMQVNTRKTHWKSKRVFFATPQVIYNDLKSGTCPADKIRCLVFDEAHKARGNYAYCQIVGSLDDMGFRTYRILALSATPGSKVDDVVNVVKSLHIAHLELRTENCIDVAPYSHSRKINTVVIQIGDELTLLRQQYVEILDGYARRLKQLNILPQNLGNLSKGRIVMLYKEYQTKDRGSRHPQHNWIMKDFTLLIALYHGLELLVKHGSRVFLNFFDEHPEKSWIQQDDQLTALLERLRDDLGINPLSLDRSILPDGTTPDIPQNLHFGHPKFDKLKEIMLNHFNKAKKNNQDTRAIVFCEYRESVNLVHCLLLQCKPLITAQTFVGQGASGKDGKTVVSQKQQLRVMRNFRNGLCNTLVATCVAEEGLDVGSVDLILCFDVSTRSPVRLVQRCGRTGRERSGQVYILVTEGREHQTLLDCMRQRDGLNKKILQSREIEHNLYKMNPRMLPRDHVPECQKMYVTVTKKIDPKESSDTITKSKKPQKDLRTMLLSKTSNNLNNASSSNVGNNLITEVEFNNIFDKGFHQETVSNDITECWALGKESFIRKAKNNDIPIKHSSWLEWQRTLQNTVNVGHSRDSEILSELLQYSDAKRFDLAPSTQIPECNYQDNITNKPSPVKTKNTNIKKKQKQATFKSPIKKDGDIRALFSTATKSTKSYTKLINELGVPSNGVSTALIDLMVDLSLVNTNTTRKCYLCLNNIKCSVFKSLRNPKEQFTLNNLTLPQLNLIDDINSEVLDDYNTKIIKNEKTMDQIDLLENNKVCSTNFELEFDFDSPVLETENENNNLSSSNANIDTNFDIGDVDEIFATSSPEETEATKNEVKNTSYPKEALEFFGLDSIEDIFADSDESNIGNGSIKTDKSEIRDKSYAFPAPIVIENPKSPSLLSGTRKVEPTSPILCTQRRKFNLGTKKKVTGSSTPIPHTQSNKTLDKEFNKNQYSSNINITNTDEKSMFTITQLVDMINKTTDEKSKTNPTPNKDDMQSFSLDYRERSASPILLTQVEKKNLTLNQTNKEKTNKSVSLVILETDSESDDTEVYDIETTELETANERNTKRKLDDDFDENLNNSPYFNKRLKLDEDCKKSLSLQQKIITALKSNKINKDVDKEINYLSLTPGFNSQKENISPKFKTQKEFTQQAVNKLNAFKYDPKKPFASKQMNSEVKPMKRELNYDDDSDDDFVPSSKCATPKVQKIKTDSVVNHKMRKKKKNEFLDLEAELSDNSDKDSGDEMSDDSVGSIVEFICDENEDTTQDMYAHYLKSVKSPVKGVFKIPALPKQYNESEIFSQFVEEDAYEIDSFCVDSRVELTQVPDESVLEVAEKLLEKRRKAKRKQPAIKEILSQGESPVLKRNTNNRLRRISSDSE